MCTRSAAAFGISDFDLGVELDQAADDAHRTRITTDASRAGAYIIKTNGHLVIAHDVRALLRGPEA
jgi:acetate kinase